MNDEMKFIITERTLSILDKLDKKLENIKKDENAEENEYYHLLALLHVQIQERLEPLDSRYECKSEHKVREPHSAEHFRQMKTQALKSMLKRRKNYLKDVDKIIEENKKIIEQNRKVDEAEIRRIERVLEEREN